MRHNWKRMLSLVLTTAMLTTACSSAGQTENTKAPAGNTETKAAGTGEVKQEDVTFTYFNPDPAIHKPADDAPVLENLYQKTGVKFDWDIPASNAVERMNIMLAMEELPDLINFSARLSDKTLLNQFVEAGYLVDLAPLMQEYAPKTWENLKEVLPRVLDADGHLWFLPSGYMFPDSMPYTEARVAFYSSSKYFDENGWDKYPETFEEYEELLKTVKSETGVTPMGLALGANGDLDSIINVGAGAKGLVFSDRMINDGGKLKWFTQSEEMKDYFKWLNSLYLQGLLDPESAIMSYDMLSEKVASGQVWSYAGRGRHINIALDKYEINNNSTARAASMWLKADDSVDKRTYAQYTENMITTGLAVTKACKNPERLMEFYEYLNTEEGHMDAVGITNFDWDGTPEGEVGYDYVITDKEYIEGRPFWAMTDWSTNEWTSDDNWWWNRGREMMWPFTYAADGVNHPDGKYDVIGDDDASVWWDEEQTRIYNEFGMTGTNYTQYQLDLACDVSEFTGLMLDGNSQEYIEYLDMVNTVNTTLPKVILATSEAEFETQWEGFTAELSKNGLDHVMEAFNAKMQTRLENWEKNAQ